MSNPSFLGKAGVLCAVLLIILSTAGCVTEKTENTQITNTPAHADNADWWKSAVAYEIYVSSFKDTNGDGYGDLNGITSKLDTLKSIGADILWLTPVYKSPMVDNGYDVSNGYEINPLYGTMADMDNLIAEADKRGIRIMMDLVVNHLSDQSMYFIESAKSKDNPYSDYFIWRDPAEDGGAPNNWRSIFGGSAWTYNQERNQYYLHTFAKEQPDLNWENQNVRKEIQKWANFWLDKGVCGFRIDAVPYIKKPADFSSKPADGEDGLAKIAAYTTNIPGILDFLQEFKDAVNSGRTKDVVLVGEANGITVEDMPQWVGSNGVMNMIFSFDHVETDVTDSPYLSDRKPVQLIDVKHALSRVENASNNGIWTTVYFENHDRPRAVNTFFKNGADRKLAAKVIGTILYTLRGTPFIYQGQEIGMENCEWEMNEINDLNAKSQYTMMLDIGIPEKKALTLVSKYNRDNARTPLQWDASKNAGFTTGTPWLKINPNYLTVNYASQEKSPDSVLNWYRKLAGIRENNPVLTRGDYLDVLPDDEAIYAYSRNYDDTSALVLLNFENTDVAFDSGILNGYKLLISSYGEGEASDSSLRPLESRIYMKE